MPLTVPHLPLGLTSGIFPPSANMAVWLRKGMGITASSNNVSQWNDQSGNGRNAVQATGASQPTLQSGGTVLFNGTSHTMTIASFSLVQPLTIYMRVKQVTWTAGHYFCDGTTTNTAVIFQTSVSPQISIFAGSSAASNNGFPVNTWGSIAAVFNGASSALQTPGTTATGNPGAGSPGGITIGSSSVPSAWGNIELAELIVYSAAHDATQRASVISYLNTL